MKSKSILFLLLVAISTWVGSCKQTARTEAVLAGKALAAKHCSGCHLLPDPTLLDKATWKNGVLPAMAEQLGIEVLEGNIYLHQKQSAISSTDWNRLVAYYETLAPEMLDDSEKNAPVDDWALFSIKKPKADSLIISSTLLVGIDSAKSSIYTSDLEDPGIYRFDNLNHKQLVTRLPSSAIDICFPSAKQPQTIITCMGGMRALDVTKGQIFTLTNDSNAKPKVISDDLTRPIKTQPIDFNKDGLMDYLVCAFGHNLGGLYILKQTNNHIFEKVAIREVPGATDSIIRDFNSDGWPDVMTLFAHGDEGIWLFLNNKMGGFATKNVLRFPSVYGSSSFQFADVTNDGRPDIVYTAGDNSDFSRILKPYHGLYIFEGKGNFEFGQKYFYPIHGCMKALAADFDKDGDVDIATIAFFADFEKRPKETFLYFEQAKSAEQSKLGFKPHAVPIYKDGRWICMNVQDYDGDGDPDIVLGNYSKGFLNQENLKPTWDVHMPFVLLENKTIPGKPL
ncbi:VCBS repeat-containing protein [Dyadobacter sp. CY326]|uniref:FG-GAP repeat domain-containing protein n=1 Tax=Dyadobacter sp. CY326 TaxID=2907300 RepID=UPI001F3C99AA|nr:VCBS repeat-containing protein [Dyadobacter sp. CY326]MCE7065717.1 VCBS repeat-containing protein [Dyadobacter sp. CY326]